MEPSDLLEHKHSHKRLASQPQFKPMKKGKFPKPFKTMGGMRLHSTDLIDVSDTHCVIFIWRDGDELIDSLFLGWLMCKLRSGELSPLFEMHLHPSHKGLHVKMPCKTDLDYTSRQLPGAPEFDLKFQRMLDPRSEKDREILIADFCKRCGIEIGDENSLWNS
ncbi:hypothetical protein ACO0LG_09035 [Undibacterium sp. Ji42W]|uniref:hypothetical protein n=1 Tax=Undibacterium sp. Ji42W TaxID=3413039 RepID=UPI003BEF7549